MNKEDLYRELKRRILSEKIPPGTWLVEREISDTFSVSRTPVREVLRILANDGIIVLEPNKGYYVRELNFEELIESFHARESIEGMAARLACKRADQKFFRTIKKIKTQLYEVDIENKPSQGVKIGQSLHDTIIVTANNKLLTEFYGKLKNITVLTRNKTRMSVSIEQSSRNDHIEITEAFLEKDEDKCENAMRKHIRGTCFLLTQHHLMQ